MIPAPPPALASLPYGTQLIAGLGTSQVVADFDFETYSEAGFVWNEHTRKWGALPGAAQGKKGLPVVGAKVYSEHPSTEILMLGYDLKDGQGPRQWFPGDPPPADLFAHLAAGLLIEAHNVGFEYWIWTNVAVPRLGWPPLPVPQLRCSAAKSRASGLPGALAEVGKVLDIEKAKDPKGKTYIKRFCIPRNPSAKDPRTRIMVSEDPDGPGFCGYNVRDIQAEAEVSSQVPDLSPIELQYWQHDRAINVRGVQVDTDGVADLITIVEQAHERYNAELKSLTFGAVEKASETIKMSAFISGFGVHLDSMDEENLDAALLRDDLPPVVRRILEIRQTVGSAAVKKLFAMRLQTSRAGRLHDLFTFHAAHTGRPTGNGAQPTNLPNSGPELFRCSCGKYYGLHLPSCPGCVGGIRDINPSTKSGGHEWNVNAAENVFEIARYRSLELIEYYFGHAMAAVSGCLRGLFIAAPGHDLICADYSAIEAVVLAMLAGEQWRIDVFKSHGKIYEASAATAFGVPVEEILEHKKRTGDHHPLRKLGKIMELALGYQGWIGAALAFGLPGTDDEIKQTILKWRSASPAIVAYWGGQSKNWEPCLHGIEGAAIFAVQNPGKECEFGRVVFVMRGDALYCRLPSGRYITYRRPRLRKAAQEWRGMSLSYEGWNTNPKNGPTGWIRKDTWGGKLTENIVQAVANDILRFATVNLEAAGYPVVLHVYDEIVSEVPQGFGSVEEFERIMGTMPAWAWDWPIRAAGGWRGRRYRK